MRQKRNPAILKRRLPGNAPSVGGPQEPTHHGVLGHVLIRHEDVILLPYSSMRSLSHQECVWNVTSTSVWKRSFPREDESMRFMFGLSTGIGRDFLNIPMF